VCVCGKQCRRCSGVRRDKWQLLSSGAAPHARARWYLREGVTQGMSVCTLPNEGVTQDMYVHMPSEGVTQGLSACTYEVKFTRCCTAELWARNACAQCLLLSIFALIPDCTQAVSFYTHSLIAHPYNAIFSYCTPGGMLY